MWLFAVWLCNMPQADTLRYVEKVYCSERPPLPLHNKQNIWFAIFAGLLTNVTSTAALACIVIVESYHYYRFTLKDEPFRLDNHI